MKFDNSEALANHVKKIRNYLKGDAPVNQSAQKNLQTMNMDDLRNYFQSETRTYEDIQKQATRAKERQLVDEIEDFKREKNDIRLELDLKRDRELRAKMEKQQIQKALQEIEKNKATHLEKEKRRELERLAIERENLRQKEEQVLEDIRQLEGKMEEKERNLQLEKSNINNQRQGGYDNSVYNGRKKEINLAKERGEHIANLQLKRDMLENDRLRIMDDLVKIQTGDTSFRRNEASRWAANDILKRNPSDMAIDITRMKLDPAIKDKLLNDEVKIKYLKEQREKTLRDMVPDYEEEPMRTYELQQSPIFQMNKIPNNQPAGPRTIPSPKKELSPYRAQQQKSQKVKFEDEEPMHLDIAGNIRKLRQDYQSSGEGDAEFFAYLNDLENHIIRGEAFSRPQPILQQSVEKSMPKIVQNSSVKQQEPEPQYQKMPSMPRVGIQSFMPQTPMMPQPPNMVQQQQMMQPSQMMPPPQYQNYIPQQPYIPPPSINLESLLPKFSTPFEQYQQPAPVYQQNENIEQMTKLLSDQSSNNQLLEQGLLNLQQGLITFEEFERLLQDPAMSQLDQQKKKLLQGSGIPIHKKNLPDDFRFRQNDYRAEDMETEERALMNIAAQEFDELRILSKIPKSSDLYRHKMEQYKEMSAMRAEMEKMLQEQKLEKLRRDFERQKHDDQQRFKHDRWLEEQQKAIVEAKLNIASQIIPEQEYEQFPQQQQQQYYPQQQNVRGFQTPNKAELSREQSVMSEPEFPLPEIKSIKAPVSIQQQQPFQSVRSEMKEQTTDDQTYNPQVGFNVYFDFISKLQRQYRSMRLVYAVYNVSRSLVPPSLIDIHDAEPDPEDPNEKNRIIFREYSSIKGVQAHPSSNFIIEFQVPKPNTGSSEKYISFGWTLLNLFDNKYNFNTGMFKLPIYQSPTRTDIDIRDIQTLQRIPDTLLMFRIGVPGDINTRFQMNAMTSVEEYQSPKLHQFSQKNVEYLGSLNPLEIPSVPDMVMINPQYDCKGVRVYVNFMKYYVPSTHSKVQLTLYEGTNIIRTDDGRMCNWASKQFDSQNLLFSQPTNPMNQQIGITPSEIARGEIVTVEDETTWIKNLYNIQFNDKGIKTQDEVNMVLQVMEAKGQRGMVMNDAKPEYQALGYGVFRMNNLDGTIKYGTHDVPIFKPPVNLSKRNPADLMKHVIKITILKPEDIPKSQNPFNPPQKQLPDKKSMPPTPINRPSPKQNNNNERPFIQNLANQLKEVPFLDGEGIDLYIDGARFLPENATYSRIIMRGFSRDQTRVLNPVKGTCDLDMSTNKNPFYGFRFEIRGQKLDPTMIIQATIETIDRSDGQPKVIGFAYFPLFTQTQNRTQPSSKAGQMLQNGCYQIPIYLEKPMQGQQLTMENIQKLEKISCATLLVRCYKAPMEQGRAVGLQEVNMREWQTKGVIMDPPDYQDTAYNTQYCNNSAFENELYDIKASRISVPMRVVTQYLMRVNSQNNIADDDQFQEWVDRFLTPATQYQTILSTKYFSSYVPRIGFRFTVERLHGVNQKVPHIVTTSIAPPASLYAGAAKKTQDVTVFTDYSPDTPWQSLQFNEEPINYTGLPMTVKLGFVIDVKALKQGANGQYELEDLGWTFLAIYNVLENEDGSQSIYINSGLYALPLFPGPVPKDIQGFITSNQQNIMGLLKMDKNNKTIEFTSIIVRIHDNQREIMAPKGYYGDLNNSLLPIDKAARFVFNNDQRTNLAISANESAKGVIPQQIQAKNVFKNTCMQAFSKKYGVI